MSLGEYSKGKNAIGPRLVYAAGQIETRLF